MGLPVFQDAFWFVRETQEQKHHWTQSDREGPGRAAKSSELFWERANSSTRPNDGGCFQTAGTAMVQVQVPDSAWDVLAE